MEREKWRLGLMLEAAGFSNGEIAELLETLSMPELRALLAPRSAGVR